MAAKKVDIETRPVVGALEGAHRVRLLLPPEEKSSVDVLGEGPEAAPAVVDLLERLAVVR
jgi:electron transfer flavoprotein beta subunit